MAGRPRTTRAFPNGFRQGQAVKVSNAIDFKGFKLGLVYEVCKENEGGIVVWLTGDSRPGFFVSTCIHPERGDTIIGIEK